MYDVHDAIMMAGGAAGHHGGGAAAGLAVQVRRAGPRRRRRVHALPAAGEPPGGDTESCWLTLLSRWGDAQGLAG
jgi:hypothetical protein